MRFPDALLPALLALALLATPPVVAGEAVPGEVAPGEVAPGEVTAGDVAIAAPWTRATAPGARVGAGYLTLRSLGGADRLIGGRTEAAAALELHTHEHGSDGVMRMRAVESIAIPAGETVILGPGGLHLMLVGLTEPLVEGGRLPVTLVFETAGEVALELAVAGPGARNPPVAGAGEEAPGRAGQDGAGQDSAGQGGHHRH